MLTQGSKIKGTYRENDNTYITVQCSVVDQHAFLSFKLNTDPDPVLQNKGVNNVRKHKNVKTFFYQRKYCIHRYRYPFSCTVDTDSHSECGTES